MSSLSKLESIFFAALEKGPGQDRAAFLDHECSGDADLRQRVEKMLAAQVNAGSFLESPAADRPPTWNEDLGTDRTSETEVLPSPESEMPLDFLLPSQQPGHLGRLGHYEVLEVVGRGGMGIVLRASDEKLQRVVAIKVMAPQLASSAAARKRFSREAQAAAAISHDHVVTIHAVEEAGGLPYLAMQYVSGLSLQQRLDKSGSLELREIVRIGMQTAAGLAAAHAQGLIHRDIKPANILLENGVERVKITDFGLARAVADASLTQAGMVAGTPQYMSPEQARGETVDRRSDLFSLGSVLYAMCTGRPPFRGDSGISVLKRVCDDTPHPIRETNPDIPEWLEAIVAKLHAKDPGERYQTAAEVAELLNEHLAHLQHPSVVPLPVMEKPARLAPVRRRFWATAAAVLLCVVGGLGLTEAAGVTKLTASVIRVLTPKGTLVVEVDDPGVKVTIEGDGGLVITGAGPQEVRLRPGSYKMRATKDGKSIREEELITITRGDKRVVKVSHEAASVPTPPITGKPASQPFVVLGSKGVAARNFDTLAEAVQGASNGDTIEIRGNGPFVSPSLSVQVDGLTIRAAEGFVPVVRLISDVTFPALLSNSLGRLVLEGLDLQLVGFKSGAGVAGSRIVHCGGSGRTSIANCRLHVSGAGRVMRVEGDQSFAQLRNSTVCGAVWFEGGRFVAENSVLFVPQGPICQCPVEAPVERSLRLQRCTLVGKQSIIQFLDALSSTIPAQSAPHFRCEVAQCILDGKDCVLDYHPWARTRGRPKLSPEERRQVLLAGFKLRVDWQGERNAYPAETRLIGGAEAVVPDSDIKTLAGWNEYWGFAEEGAAQGVLQYQAGDVRASTELTPYAYRLRPGSAGYGAARDGKDLGADIDLVGPGQPYDQWKTTPEYQQWLKDTGQWKE